MTTEELKEKVMWYRTRFADKLFEGVLLNIDDVKAINQDIEEFDSSQGVGFYLLEDIINDNNIVEAILSKELTIRITYSELYSCEEEIKGGIIKDATLRNVENNQRLIIDWEYEDYEKSDEYDRELCTYTDSYYDWTSELTSFVDCIREEMQRIDKYINIEDFEDENDYYKTKNNAIEEKIIELENEWSQIIGKYSDTIGIYNPPTVEEIIQTYVHN